MIDVVASAFLLLGALLALAAAVALVRFPDVFSRMHAATKPATLGVIACAAGAALQIDSTSLVAKLAVAVVLQLVTAPVGAHLLARSISRSGEPRPPTTS